MDVLHGSAVDPDRGEAVAIVSLGKPATGNTGPARADELNGEVSAGQLALDRSLDEAPGATPIAACASGPPRATGIRQWIEDFKAVRVKRVFDLVVAAVALVALSPVLLVIALMVRRKLGSPVLFYQVRPGLHGRPFRMVKFRTMRDAIDRDGNPLPDAERMTPFGVKLRAMSIDELPELWNVLRGEMSLVGPRPLLMQYLPLYSPEQVRRHEVRPGVTGWAQVNGRNALSWDEKFRLDRWYVDHRSFALDLRIVWLTVRKVVMREGISAEGEATMAPFRGNGE